MWQTLMNFLKFCLLVWSFSVAAPLLDWSPSSPLSHLRCCGSFPHVRGQTPRLQETPVGGTHQLPLQDRAHGLERGLKQPDDRHIYDPSPRIVRHSPCPSFLCCRLLILVWTSVLRESLWATDQMVSQVEGDGGWGFCGLHTTPFDHLSKHSAVTEAHLEANLN